MTEIVNGKEIVLASAVSSPALEGVGEDQGPGDGIDPCFGDREARAVRDRQVDRSDCRRSRAGWGRRRGWCRGTWLLLPLALRHLWLGSLLVPMKST